RLSRPTLFPYTTLFRSSMSRCRCRIPARWSTIPSCLKLRLMSDEAGNLQQIVLNDNQSFGTDWEQVRAYIVQLVGDQAGPTSDEDRKSTRLNSSHVKIS